MEKNCILNNERIYSSDDIRLVSLDILRYRALKLYIIMGIIFLILGSSFIGLSFVLNNDITILTSGIIILALVLFLFIFYMYAKNKANKAKYIETTYKYSFYEDELVVFMDSTDFHQNMTLKYKDVVKVVKRKQYTFIFINRLQALFFFNTDLNEEVYDILKKNVAKYKD